MARPAQKETGRPVSGQGHQEISREPVLADIVDLGHLSRYTMGDVALERELLRMFAAQLEDISANLRSAQGPRHFRLLAHTLKGAARAVGAFGLARLAAALEETGPGKDALALLDALDGERKRFRAALTAWEEAHRDKE